MAKSSNTSEYAIVLDDETSGPAKASTRALVALRAQIERDQQALRGMQSALARMRGTSLASSDAAKRLRDQIAAQRQRVGQAQAAYLSLGGTFGQTAGETGGLVSMLGGLVGAAGGAASIARALIAAYAAMVTGVLAAAAALGTYALAQADARRSELLHLESLTTIRRYYGLAAGTGAELQGAIDRVADSSALGRGELARYTDQLYRMGLRGRALESALEGVSTVAATQGDAQAARYAGMYAGLVRTGGGVERLSERIRSRLGGLAARSALGLGRQLERLRESFGRIFGDVRIEGFLQALHAVVSLFSQSTETGRALHEIVTDLFSPIFDSVGGAIPLVRGFFQGMIIAGLQVAIVVLRVRNAILRTFGGDTKSTVDSTTSAVNAGRLALVGLVGVLALLAIPLVAVGGALYVAYREFTNLVEVVKGAGQTLLDWTTWGRTVGASLPAGIVAGLRSGIGLVRQEVAALGAVAEGTLRDTLGIHSPSRVFADLGIQIPRGFAEGVEAGTGAASDSVATMADASVGAASSGSSRLGGATSITVGDVHVHLASGSPDEARRAAEAVVDEIVRMLEGVGIELGGGS